ncbi:hypothetical protein ACI3LY_002642 [Candidozyma auris]|uniref:Uncharacterized protein n=2 Tax=Candidozyma auris TaxID=498019 RepID=A0A2H0ZM90_CANAR|nr:hypothetical protein QG37_01907 [[Candida] auris]PIS51736.1 hypothetical protein B9J08_003333 [[Candida] auris]QWW21918.1 hypothetical protein CA7LBN_000664 [[Candida] auris]
MLLANFATICVIPAQHHLLEDSLMKPSKLLVALVSCLGVTSAIPSRLAHIIDSNSTGASNISNPLSGVLPVDSVSSHLSETSRLLGYLVEPVFQKAQQLKRPLDLNTWIQLYHDMSSQQKVTSAKNTVKKFVSASRPKSKEEVKAHVEKSNNSSTAASQKEVSEKALEVTLSSLLRKLLGKQKDYESDFEENDETKDDYETPPNTDTDHDFDIEGESEGESESEWESECDENEIEEEIEYGSYSRKEPHRNENTTFLGNVTDSTQVNLKNATTTSDVFQPSYNHSPGLSNLSNDSGRSNSSNTNEEEYGKEVNGATRLYNANFASFVLAALLIALI